MLVAHGGLRLVTPSSYRSTDRLRITGLPEMTIDGDSFKFEQTFQTELVLIVWLCYEI